jgi:hypothetical protein
MVECFWRGYRQWITRGDCAGGIYVTAHLGVASARFSGDLVGALVVGNASLLAVNFT